MSLRVLNGLCGSNTNLSKAENEEVNIVNVNYDNNKQEPKFSSSLLIYDFDCNQVRFRNIENR